MSKNNRIKIVGTIEEMPRLVLDAPTFAKRAFETKIKAERRSGKPDTLILQFSGAMLPEEDFNNMQIGTFVRVAGEIRTENEREIVATKPSVKIFIAANKIAVIDPTDEKKNSVKLRGRICKDPRIRETPRGKHVADLMVVTSGRTGANFIPCICWEEIADAAVDFKKGMYVEIEGRMQSRDYRRQIEGSTPYLMTAYEVSITQIGIDLEEAEETMQPAGEDADAPTLAEA